MSACVPADEPGQTAPPSPVVLSAVLAGLEEPVVPAAEALYRPANRTADFVTIELEVASQNAAALGVIANTPALANSQRASADRSAAFSFELLRNDGERVHVRLRFPRAWIVEDGLRLRIFDAVDAGGAAVQYASLRVVDDFFYIAAIGDSVIWGNGLAEQDKFTRLVARTLERERGVGVVMQRFAHSGATILDGPRQGLCTLDCVGEVPRFETAIPRQALQVMRPELIDLVLMNGCINDVGINRIIEPEVSEKELRFVANLACGEIALDALRTVRTTMPNAAIAYCGYYQIIGPTSDLFGIGTFDVTSDELGLELGELLVSDLAVLAAQRDDLVLQSRAFRDVGNEALAAAVATLNAESAAGPPAVFVDPQFGEANAVFTPQRWLWSMTNNNPRFDAFPDIPYDLFPEDDTQGLRILRCFDEGNLNNPVFCLYVSVGHPNREGARQYAARITQALREIRVLPTAP